MRIAICDDELSCQEQLLKLLSDYAIQNPSKKFNYQVFSEPTELFNAAVLSNGFDIYLLDILMPDMNGISLGQKLREANLNGKILYLTSSKEFALDAYKVKAWNYLLKPVNREELFSVLDELFNSLNAQKNQFILVKTIENSVKLYFREIVYLELCKRKLLFHLTNGNTVDSTTIRTSFTEAVQDLLKDSCFFLCSAGIAVNLEHITMVSHDSVTFADGQQLYLPKKGCRELRSVWYDYCFKEETFYDNF